MQGGCYNLTLYYPENEVRQNNKVLTWLSIPYAKPPVNELRCLSPKSNGTDFPNEWIFKLDFLRDKAQKIVFI